MIGKILSRNYNMNLNKDEQIQAESEKHLAQIRHQRALLFKEHGHVKLKPFATEITPENQENTIVCVCGETLCYDNDAIQEERYRQSEKIREQLKATGQDRTLK